MSRRRGKFCAPLSAQLLELQESFRRLAEKHVASAENILEELENELEERDEDFDDVKDKTQA